jgi:diguanylate cyclase (GGDEF)-like protein
MQRTLDGLLQLSVASARVLEPSLLYPKVLGELIHLLGAERAFLFLQQEDRLCFETGIDANGSACSEETGHAASLVQRVAQSQRIVLLRGDEGLDSTESVATHDIRSVLAAPMLFRDRLLGVIYLDSRLARGVFGADDLQVLQALASQVAITLETARSARLEVQVRSEREQRVLAEQLGEIVGSMLVHLNQERVLQVLLAGLERVLGYDRGAAFLWKDDHFQPAVTHGEWQPLDHIAESGRPQIFLEGMAISAPLEAHSGKLGAITLVRSQGNAFHQGDIEWMHTFTGYASLALENARLFADVERLATTDELTGMLNRRQFFNDAHSEWQRAHRLGHPLSVIMFDVDHFKKFNDTYGHATGDVVLRTVAARCRKCFRNIDIQGRLGGEEFAIVLVGTGLEAALQTAERLRLNIAEEPFESPLGPLDVRISLGVAQPAPGETLEEVLERSDQALYRAKAGGRNRVEADQREANSLG